MCFAHLLFHWDVVCRPSPILPSPYSGRRFFFLNRVSEPTRSQRPFSFPRPPFLFMTRLSLFVALFSLAASVSFLPFFFSTILLPHHQSPSTGTELPFFFPTQPQNVGECSFHHPFLPPATYLHPNFTPATNRFRRFPSRQLLFGLFCHCLPVLVFAPL